jgi:hypothetical protein
MWQPVSVAAREMPTKPCKRRTVMGCILRGGFSGMGRPPLNPYTRDVVSRIGVRGGDLLRCSIDLSGTVPLTKPEQSP